MKNACLRKFRTVCMVPVLLSYFLHCFYCFLYKCNLIGSEGILVIQLTVDVLYRLVPVYVGMGGEVLERDQTELLFRDILSCCKLCY